MTSIVSVMNNTEQQSFLSSPTSTETPPTDLVSQVLSTPQQQQLTLDWTSTFNMDTISIYYYYFYAAIGLLLTLLLVYWILDLHYFTRLGLVYISSRFMKKKCHILDQTKVAGVCLTTDVDYLLTHMNNARYLRELDFARADFYQRTGLYSAIQSKGGAVLQGSSTIRYRKFIRLFSIYHITSKIIYWDTSSIYMEHRFISPKDDFVRAIAICKQRLLNVDGDQIMRDLLSNEKCPGGPEAVGHTKPEVPLDLLRWIEFNEISSANLRNGC